MAPWGRPSVPAHIRVTYQILYTAFLKRRLIDCHTEAVRAEPPHYLIDNLILTQQLVGS